LKFFDSFKKIINEFFAEIDTGMVEVKWEDISHGKVTSS
jgi:hypothetical protein